MASSQSVELEAAKFLHKLIQDSKDEPAKLATKLHVILQHMKTSGKEHSMPYQVISRAMETVINQHSLDIEALNSSRLPSSGSTQIGSSQAVGVAKDSRVGLAENEMPKMGHFASGRPPVAPSSGATDFYQGSVTQRSGQSLDQESPSSLDSRSANSQSQDRHDAAKRDKQVKQKDGKKATSKRKRGDTSSPVEPHADVSSQLDSQNTVNTRKGKMRAESSDGLPVKSGDLTKFNMVPSSIQMDHFPALSGSMQTIQSANQEGAYAKVHGGMVVATTAQPMSEPVFSSSMQYGSVLENDSGSSTSLSDRHKIAQIGRQGSFSETTGLRQGFPPKDTGKSAVSAVPESSSVPFKEQQLKQLRAQCLVFLAFRNSLAPKKLHLEIALGASFSREGKDLIDHKGISQSSSELGNSSGVMMPFGCLNNVRQSENIPSGSSSAGKTLEADSYSKGTENPRVMEDKGLLSEERKHLLAAKKGEFEKQIQEKVAVQSSSTTSFQQDSSSTRGSLVVNNLLDDVNDDTLLVARCNYPSSVTGLNKQTNPEISGWTGFASHSEASKGPPQPSQFLNIVNNGGSRNHDSYSLKDHWKPIVGIDVDPQGAMMIQDTNSMTKHVSSDGFKSVPVDGTSRQEGNQSLLSNNLPPPKYTMSERWIMDQQRNRLQVEQNWIHKQQKTKQRMVTSFHKLKANVNSSEDIANKTKSVIELKKLQLLDLQRRLRSDFLNDFFKPITTEMEHLKSIKKHRHGRRVKQLEKYEQKMKEERQKRIRERQKEFFSEIEIHKERLDDVFKMKRERWKGLNRYVKEFHKRKERIHREKIDRIQREKINLLKINDVEGYLRMVQDAKSDRVKQLLKETEKYLQKLGSKLREAKAAAGPFEHDVDEVRSGSFLENSETNIENENETDQAKHYMESNEKYYKMAHSVKESIAEQPSYLQGGKLREYQMNGLRWLVSLYNNHLNGILADEMGLGKTVQVISLICYLMETKNDRGPFLVVVPSSVLPGWESEINFWAPSILKIVYAGPPEERRRLFKEKIVHQKFNVLLTTYEYLMNKHDRPKLSKIHWHYVIIDEGHRIKNASCKLNAELKHYQSSHRLLLTGTPLQNSLEELWALLNFLLPNIFNSSEDFSQWFNKPFESSGDNSPDEALLSEEENLLIINRLHQVLRPFVLRRLKHKVENELPEKIERLVRCEASAYQKLLMKRVEENLGSIGNTKSRSVHNSVMELRNICNHPYLSHLHAEEVDNLIPKHYLPPIIRLCGKLEMLDRILPKLKAADHRVLFFSTMTRLLDVMEEYLTLKQHSYLRLDGHTSGNDRGALIDLFNQTDSPYFIFLLSIRAGGVGVNLQAADTVILFDTDWNPQVDLQAQARAHRIGQKKDVLVLRFETVQTVEEQVRAAAEHKLGVANQSITAGFFDNNTSAEDRREYLESLLRECKKEEAAPVLHDDALNHLLARCETELDVFEAVDKTRQEDEMATWKTLVHSQALDGSELIPPLPSRLVTYEDLKQFYEVMKISDVPKAKGDVASNGVKRKSHAGEPDTRHYGRGKRAREVRSYEEQWTEEEFDKMCQSESSELLKVKEVTETSFPTNAPSSAVSTSITITNHAAIPVVAPLLPSAESFPVQQVKEMTPPAKRGRGRPRRITLDKSPAAVVPLANSGAVEMNMQLHKGTLLGDVTSSTPESIAHSSEVTSVSGPVQQCEAGVGPNLHPTTPVPTVTANSQPDATSLCAPIQEGGQGQKTESGGESTRRRGKKQVVLGPNLHPTTPVPTVTANSQPDATSLCAPIKEGGQGQKTEDGGESTRCRGKKQVVLALFPPIHGDSVGPDLKVNDQLEHNSMNRSTDQAISQSETVSCIPTLHHSTITSSLSRGKDNPVSVGVALNSQQALPLSSVTLLPQTTPPHPPVPIQNKGKSQKSQSGSGAPRRRGKKQVTSPPIPDVSGRQDLRQTSNPPISSDSMTLVKAIDLKSLQENYVQKSIHVIRDQAPHLKSTERSNDLAKQTFFSSSMRDNTVKSSGPEKEKVQIPDLRDSTSDTLSKTIILQNSGNENFSVPTLPVAEGTKDQFSEANIHHSVEASKVAPSVGPPVNSFPGSGTIESFSKPIEPTTAKVVPSAPSCIANPSTLGSESTQSYPSESIPVKKQGRKAQNRVEPPRRRGKKPTLASPVVPEALACQDPKLTDHLQGSSVDSLVDKATTNVTRAQPLHIGLPIGVSTRDLKRKERATNSPLNKQQKCSSARTDGAPVSSDVVTTFSRIQNVNDVARVMKEVFSGTCSPKPKALDSVGSEDRNTPPALLKSKAAVDALNSPSKEDKTGSDIPTTEAACLTSDHATIIHERQSFEESNDQNLDIACSDMPTTRAMDASNNQCSQDSSGSQVPTTRAECPTSDRNRDKMQSEETSNIHNRDGETSSDVPISVAVDTSNSQCEKDKAGLDHTPITRAECPTSDHNRDKTQTEEASNIQNLDGETSSDVPIIVAVDTSSSNSQCEKDKAGLDHTPITRAECPTSDHNRDKTQTEEASNIQNLDGETSSDVPIIVAVDTSSSNSQCEKDKAGLDHTPITRAECPTSDHNRDKMQSEEASNIQNLDGETSSDVPIIVPVDTSKSQCEKDKAGLDHTPTTRAECPTSDHNRDKMQLEEASNIQNLDGETSSDVPIIVPVDTSNSQGEKDKAVLDHTPTTRAECPTSDHNRDKMRSEEASNIQNLDGETSSDVPIIVAVDTSNSKCEKDKAGLDHTPTSRAECPTSDHNRDTTQSEEASNIQNLDGETSSDVSIIVAVDTSNSQCEKDKAGLDHTPITGGACLTLDPVVNQRKQSVEASNLKDLEGKASSGMSTIGVVGTLNGQGLEDKASSDATATEAASLTIDLGVSRHKKLSEEDSNIQNREGKESLDMPTTGAVNLTHIECLEDKAGSELTKTLDACLSSDLAAKKHEKQSEAAKVNNQYCDDPVDRLVLQPSGLEAVVNDLVDDSVVGPLISETAVLPPTKIDASSERGPLRSLLAPGELKDCMTTEESDSDATKVDGISGNCKSGDLATSVTSEGKSEVETLSDKAVPETKSVDGVPTTAVGERVESLSEKDSVFTSSVKLDTKESEASATAQCNPVVQDNALEDVEQSLPSAAEDKVAVSSPEKDLTACTETSQESKECVVEDGGNTIQDSGIVSGEAHQNMPLARSSSPVESENVQSLSEKEPGQSSVAGEAKEPETMN